MACDISPEKIRPPFSRVTMGRSIIIIGAGVAGMSAGCYGQMNGYDTRIFEMHNLPGGVCTSWKRKGYTVDGCLHWLTGTMPGTDFHRIWEELGVLPDTQIVYHKRYAWIEGRDGKVLAVDGDIDTLERHMKDLAPEDAKLIGQFADAVRKMRDFPIPWQKAADLMGPMDKFRIVRGMFPFMGLFRRWGRLTVADVAKRLKDPFMREAFLHIFNLENPPEFPIMAVLKTFAWMDQGTLGYPVGGSLELARTIEGRYLDLGGEVHYRSRVEKILVEDDRAVGVRLADGSEHRADVVVSAADGRTTIFDMLDGRYADNKVKGYYENMRLFPPLIYVGLGIDRVMDDIPVTMTGMNFPFEEPVRIGDRDRDHMSVQFYSYDPTLAPEGKTLARVHYPTDYDFWEELKRDPEAYRAEKERVAETVVAQLDTRFPGLASKVEMRDVATPMTWVRYTGNWRGSFEGWIETTDTLTMRMSQSLPGLKDFYMAGQWVQPGGSVPAVAMSGRNAVQIICHRDKRPFVTSMP
jgi:phytoene dehydrogenase-like protein